MTELLTDLVPRTVVTADSHPTLFSQALNLSDELSRLDVPEVVLQLADTAFFFRETGSRLVPDLHAASPDRIRAIRQALGRGVIAEIVGSVTKMAQTGAINMDVTNHALVTITGRPLQQKILRSRPEYQQRALSFS